MAAEEIDVTEDVEHPLGGIAAGFAGAETLGRPGGAACYEVGMKKGFDGEDEISVVNMSLTHDYLTAKTILEPEQARALADRLLTAAQEVEAHREGDDDG